MIQPVLDGYRIIQIAIIVVGAVIIYYSYKGYKRNGNRSLLFLAVGFLFVTIGSAIAGLLFELVNFDLTMAVTIEAGTRLVGFLLIVYSILGSKK